MKEFSLKILLFIIVTLSIFIVIISLLSYKNLIGLLGAWNQSSKMNIYLKIDSTAEDQSTLIALIKKNPQVLSVNFFNRKEVGVVFQNSLKEFSSGMMTEDEMMDLIPETIEVDLLNSLNLTERNLVFTDLANTLRAAPQVDEVSFSANWFKKFELIDKILRSAGMFIFLIIFISISYLIALMLRAHIEELKQEIEVYSLLGATRWSMYHFFLKDVFIFLTSSLLIAFAAVFWAFIYLKYQLSTSILSATISDSLRFLTFAESATIIFMLFIFIFTNSFLTVRSALFRHDQLSYD